MYGLLLGLCSSPFSSRGYLNGGEHGRKHEEDEQDERSFARRHDDRGARRSERPVNAASRSQPNLKRPGLSP